MLSAIFVKKKKTKERKRKIFSTVRIVFPFRWSLDFLRTPEHVRSHRDVHVLHAGRDGSETAAVPLVEEILDRLPNDTVRRGDDPRVSTALHRLQLPEGVRLVDRPSRDHVLLPVQRILPAVLPAEEETGGERREEGSPSGLSSVERSDDEQSKRQFVWKKGRGRLLRERRQPGRVGA